MNSSRLVQLPLDHLEAELCAFPLASGSALRLAPIALDPGLRRDTTGELWRDAERQLFETWPAVGLDECVALRDRLWFPHGPSETRLQRVSMAKYLRTLAKRCLERRGPVAVPWIHPDPGSPPVDDLETRARDAWRWLTFALPPDLLLAALADDHSAPASVETLHPVTRTRLSDQGFAETHLHVGAALDFPLLWVVVQREILQFSCQKTAFESPGASLGEGRDFCPWLLRATLARLFLAEALGSGASSCQRFLDDNATRLRERLGATGAATVAVALRELERGRLATTGSERVNHATLRRLVRSLVRHVPRLPDHPDEVRWLDPIARLVPWHQEHTASPETWFVANALRHIERHPKDQAFARLFWQVVRVRCLLYRHVVQRPLTPGLQWFLRSFDRMRPVRRSAGHRLKIESALHLCGDGKGLRSLEVRTSPEPTLSETARLTREVDAVRRSQNENRRDHFRSPLLRTLLPHVDPPERQPAARPEVGLVLHFARDRGGNWKKGQPAAFWQGGHADPFPRFGRSLKGKNPAGYRYSTYYLSQKKRAHALSRFLTSFPGSLGVIRGLDLCADETGVPTWVLAPLLRHVRGAGELASRKLRAYFGANVPPLRSTVHTGEDFIHLMTGLRHIDQAIDRFEIRNGDRLGHALALGVDPEDWADRAGRIAMPREDRLLDLVWEWRRHARGGSAPAGRIERVRDEIAMHSEAIFERSIEPRELARMEDFLHKETVLRLLRFPTGPVPEENRFDGKRGSEALGLARRYLTSPSVFDRGREIVRVETAGEKVVLKTIQDDLREKVGRRGLTVEVNPSSNLLIGHLGEMRNHPLWRLRPARDAEGLLRLSVCVGSDDPLTFATCLPDEYQLLYDALLDSGHTDAEAHRWIDDVRQRGLDARFTLPLDPDSPSIAPWLLGDGMDDVPLPP